MIKNKGYIESAGVFNNKKTWNLIHILWTWSEGPGHQEVCSLVIVLPSRIVNDKSTFNARVSPVCETLEISATYPDEILSAQNLHKWMDQTERYTWHPGIISYKKALAQNQDHITDYIIVTSNIVLSF